MVIAGTLPLRAPVWRVAPCPDRSPLPPPCWCCLPTAPPGWQLPQALDDVVIPHFGFDCTIAERQRMAEVMQFDAKAPSFTFTPDAEAKQAQATAAVRAATEVRLGPGYRQLEAYRQGTACPP